MISQYASDLAQMTACFSNFGDVKEELSVCPLAVQPHDPRFTSNEYCTLVSLYGPVSIKQCTVQLSIIPSQLVKAAFFYIADFKISLKASVNADLLTCGLFHDAATIYMYMCVYIYIYIYIYIVRERESCRMAE